MKHRASYRVLRWQLALLRALHLGEQQAVLLQAVLMGLAGALAALAFEVAADGVQWLCTGLWCGRVACFEQLAAWQRVLLPIVGALPAALVLLWAHRTDARRVPDYMEAFSLRDGRLPRRQGLLRSVSAVLSLGSGSCIGKEGALMQIAAVAASAVGRWLHVSPPSLRLMVGCGAAAGMTAAFHTPLASCLFVCEVVVGSFSIGYLAPLLVASCAAYALLWAWGGQGALFACHLSFHSARSVAACVLLALLLAPLGRVWVALLGYMRRCLSGRLCFLLPRMAAAGLLVGLAAWWQPSIVGNGQEAVAALLAGSFPPVQAALLLLLKVLLTAVVFGVGTMGGVLTPTLMAGCFAGWLFGCVLAPVPGFGPEAPTAFALVGMAVFFGAAARTPVTAILLLIELTMEASLIFPLMVAVGVGYAVVRLLPQGSLYDSAPDGDSSPFEQGLAVLRVGDVMRREPLRLAQDAPMSCLWRAQLRHPGSSLPVVNAAGELVGLVPPQGQSPERVPLLRVGDDLPTALRVFERSPRWDALPVMGADGRLAGMLSRVELLQTTALMFRRELAQRR
ncbi:MAG: chloride channel protein [Akkermansia sp.]